MDKVLASLSGKKTYIAAGLALLCLLAVNVLGVDLSSIGITPSGDWVQTALGFITGIFLRAGVAKAK